MDAEDERLNVGWTSVMATSEWHEKPNLVLPGKVHAGEQRLDKMFRGDLNCMGLDFLRLIWLEFNLLQLGKEILPEGVDILLHDVQVVADASRHVLEFVEVLLIVMSMFGWHHSQGLDRLTD